MLEAFPLEHGAERGIGLRDPAGFTDQVAVLSGPVLDLVSLFDGAHTVPRMIEILRERHGHAPTQAQIAALIERLDGAGFLDSERFAERRRAIEEAFRASPSRAAVHAGAAYARDPAALEAQIDAFWTQPEGPRHRAADVAPGPSLRGLIAPHIDFHRGGATYAWAYQELRDRSDADLFVILGTCHAGMPDPFAVTLKPYDTPLGAVPVDREFFAGLRRRYRGNLLASEVAHRTEHSIEFQAVMLRHVLGARRPFTILPVLASFLHEAVWTQGDPEGDRRVPRFFDALAETVAASRRKVCLIAGVDLAHVGPRFGDPAPNSPAFLDTVASADRRMLDTVTAGDPRGFFGAVARDGDERRICGLSPIYTFLRALPGATGRLLRYAQWPDPQGAVTFCAAAFP